ncbi:serine-rich adhesin for platelets-like isoform X2 [Watersipora subatra]|uniref:serine-rich adhesin for platelets-like isoform X2 n=1 Tax=Watersipora subatra TaxID=2589382 RepID=UPI00355C004C
MERHSLDPQLLSFSLYDTGSVESLLQEPERPSRPRERYRKKEQAPDPPKAKAPPLKSMALRLDSRNYNYSMKKSESVEEPLPAFQQRTLRSKSVDRSFEKSPKKMPASKKFFKTLLRKGKSKTDVAAPEFEAVSTTDCHSQGGEDEEDHELDGKLPKEFLDTWVSSTTHQLLDEMDQALEGVWPYDKKEDTSSYRRKSASHTDIIDGVTDDTQTTMKRKSKVPSSAWSDKGGKGTASSNFILKEKTKKNSPSTSSGTSRSLRSQYTSQPSLLNPTQSKMEKSSRSPSKDRRSSKDFIATELDGSMPKTKFREEFLQKLQKETSEAKGKENRESKQSLSPDYEGSHGTLLKKKNKPSDTSRSSSKSWDNKSQISSILKNGGGGSSTPTGTLSSQSKKQPPVAAHGRQSSVPSSTYSSSSSGQSAEFRGKEETTEGKVSPSCSNPHDSGYESGTVRSRREVIAQVHHHESATMVRGKKDISRESAYESGTIRPKKEMAPSAEFATLKRVKRSPTLSLTSRSTPRGASSAIDSIPLCFEQLTTMNVSTLQQLCASYIQGQKVMKGPEGTPKWNEIGLMEELQPIFTSNKLVLYKGYWRANPSELFTVMLTLREPAKTQTYKPNLLQGCVTFEANVSSHLIPASLYAGKKLMKATAAVAEPEEKSSKIPQHSRHLSTPVFASQLSVDDTLLAKASMPEKQRGRVQTQPIQSPISVTESQSTGTGYNRDSVFTAQSSRDSVASVESRQEKSGGSNRDQKVTGNESMVDSVQEQAAVDSILQAIAGEDQPDNLDTPDEPAPMPSIKKVEPTKPTNKVEPFTSAVKVPVAERFKVGRPDPFTGATNNNKYNRFIPEIKTSGLVKNRIANLNNNNNNNNNNDDEDDESDDDFDLAQLNSNNSNNIDDLPSGADADFSFASHFLEMAGGELPQTQVDTSETSSESTPRGATGLSRCTDKVSYSQNVTCFVTILPALPRVESIKSYLERLKSEQRSNEDLELDVIFVLLQILNIIFGLHENQLRLDSVSMSDFLVLTDSTNASTVHCHMVNVTQSANQKIGLTCEKLRMLLMQVSHSTESLLKSVIFTTVDDMIQNAEDLGDLKTISAILQYLLWGPKEDEVKVITLAEHRRQAFELWLQLARGKLLSGLALKPIDNLKAHMVTAFLANTNGSELFKITKLLNTY